MIKKAIFILLLLTAWILSGCQRSDGPTVPFESPSSGSSLGMDTAQPADASESPGITQAEPPDASLFTHEVVQNGASVTIALGMTDDEVTSLLDQAGVTFVSGNQWEDVQPGEENPGISLTESGMCEYLLFAGEGGDGAELTYIQWTLAEGDAAVLSGCVTDAIDTYGCLPLYYHSESGNDVFVFVLDGGYYSQFHDRFAGDSGGGKVMASLMVDPPNTASEPSLNYAYLLSEDPAYAASGSGPDVEAMLSVLKAQYGEAGKDGYAYSYFCDGVALFQQQLYYSFSQRQLVEDAEDGGHSSYNMQYYVPVAGGDILEGYHNEIASE